MPDKISGIKCYHGLKLLEHIWFGEKKKNGTCLSSVSFSITKYLKESWN